jgi:hypothetical protein
LLTGGVVAPGAVLLLVAEFWPFIVVVLLSGVVDVAGAALWLLVSALLEG